MTKSKWFAGHQPAKTPPVSVWDGLIHFSKSEILLASVLVDGASWCKPCRDEHPILMRLSQIPDLDVYGINFKDKPKNAILFLNKMGNPYIISGIDRDGTLSINFGAYGVPETILIDKNNKILLKYIGPLNESHYKEIISKIKG